MSFQASANALDLLVPWKQAKEEEEEEREEARQLTAHGYSLRTSDVRTYCIPGLT